MEKDRSSKVIAIVALLVAVVGLSVGFAAFTRDLTISSDAAVSPENNMKVLFSSSGTEQLAGTVTGVVTPTPVEGGENQPSADVATIASDGSTTISGLKANFTKPGQTVTYEFYAHNDGAFDAYLTTITFKTVDGTQLRECNVTEGTTAEYATNACNDITLNVTVGEDTSVITTDTSETGITNHLLAKGAYEKVVVTISYPTGSDVSDGDFDVEFGDITFTYSSVDSE